MLFESEFLEPVDYLVLGHLSCDIKPGGLSLGGTVTYASLTARALGFKPGIVTSWAGEIPLGQLEGIQIVSIPSEQSTTFENRDTPSGRRQIIHHQASPIDFDSVPEQWRNSNIVHLGPIAHEIEITFETGLSPSLMGITPQGWLRSWDDSGNVVPRPSPDLAPLSSQAGAIVISMEDVQGDEDEIEKLALTCRVLAVTEGNGGSRLYWNQDLRHFSAPEMEEVDATGAGDIFAAAFFIRLLNTRDPWEAARFATCIASRSVSRPGLEGIPRKEEIDEVLMEVI
ncbi:PfkB family carbohydrate kinase [Chloroflexota bacterium]